MNAVILFVIVFANQAPAADEKDATPASEPLVIDILAKQPPPECEAGDSDEIIVCAEPEDNQRYRLHPQSGDKKYGEERLKAELTFGDNATVAGETEAAHIGPGIPSNRVMIRIKVAF